MEEPSEAVSHAIAPHSEVVCSITPDKSTEAMPFVVFILSLMEIAARENCSPDSLNFFVFIELAI
jgi:hypothetical protein